MHQRLKKFNVSVKKSLLHCSLGVQLKAKLLRVQSVARLPKLGVTMRVHAVLVKSLSSVTAENNV